MSPTVLLAALLLATQLLPARAGMVNDYAHVLESQAVVEAEMTLSRLQRDSQIELVLVTLREARGQGAEDVALRVRQEWGVGGAAGEGGEAWPGLVVAYLDQDMQIGVSYNDAARPWIPRGEMQRIIDTVAIPALNKGDRSAALRDTLRSLTQLFRN